jgi:ankyrin repeat protein
MSSSSGIPNNVAHQASPVSFDGVPHRVREDGLDKMVSFAAESQQKGHFELATKIYANVLEQALTYGLDAQRLLTEQRSRPHPLNGTMPADWSMLHGDVASLICLDRAPAAAFAHACQARCYHLLPKLVGAGANIDGLVDGRRTLLHRSVEEGDLQGVKAALQNGASLATPPGVASLVELSVSRCKDEAETLNRLLDRGADPNVTTTGGTSLLMHAVRHGAVQCAVALLSRKSLIIDLPALAGMEEHVQDLASWVGGLMTRRALEHPWPRQITTLLEALVRSHRLPPALRCSFAPYAPFLSVCVDRGESALVRALLEAMPTNLDERDDRGDTALIRAARAGRHEIYDALLAAGASPQLRNNDGQDAAVLRRRRLAAVARRA